MWKRFLVQHNRDCGLCCMTNEELFNRAYPVLQSPNPVAEATKILMDWEGIDKEEKNAQLLLLAFSTRVLKHPVHTLVRGAVGHKVLVNAIALSVPSCSKVEVYRREGEFLFYSPVNPQTLVIWNELPNYREGSAKAAILRENLLCDESEEQLLFCVVNHKPIRDYRLACRMLLVETKEPTLRKFHYNLEKMKKVATVTSFGELMNRFRWVVSIPYAGALKEVFTKFPPSARDYRDIHKFLSLIQASAIWNILHRQHWVDEETKTIHIVAKIEDYLLVRELLNEIFGGLRLFGLTESQRRVWEHLRDAKGWLTPNQLADELQLSKKTIHTILETLKSFMLVEREKVGRKTFYRAVDISNIHLPTAEEEPKLVEEGKAATGVENANPPAEAGGLASGGETQC